MSNTSSTMYCYKYIPEPKEDVRHTYQYLVTTRLKGLLLKPDRLKVSKCYVNSDQARL